jgi:hypothetical protein
MRRLVWCGAAVLVATAAGVYMAASHAAKHPDSYWGRCLTAAATLGLHSNPFLAVTPMATRGMRMAEEACDAVAGGVGAGGAVAGMIDKPVDGAACEGHADAHEAVEPVREVEADVPHGEPIHIEVFPGESRHDITPPCHSENRAGVDFDVVVEQVLPPAGEESDVPPMSPAAEAEELPMPVECLSECPLACDEEPCKPTCCWLWKLMKLAGLMQDALGVPEMLPMPCADEEPAEDGAAATEQPEAELPPQMDPHHHHHRGCPYTGCPYPYSRCTPGTPVTPVEKPKKVKKKKVSPRTSSSAVGAKPKVCWGIGCEKPVEHKVKKPLCKKALLKKLFGASEDGQTPHCIGIDTMEFRPSDDHRDPPGTSPY